MKIFHGGCHGCISQKEFGENYCSMCCYYDANWDKPNLFRQSEDADIDDLSKNIPHRLRKGLIKKWLEELL